MTILSVCQDVAVELSQSVPATLFTSTPSVFARELRLHANRAAAAIVKAHDWQKLTALATLTGNGTDTAFDLPEDFDRMPVKARVHAGSDMNSNFREVKDLDQWIYLRDRGVGTTPGHWIILNGQMQFLPAIPNGQTAKFYYISNYAVRNQAAVYQQKFAADTDTFRLSEELLALSIVWRWRAAKRVDFSIELENFQLKLAEEIGRESGPKVLTVGRQRIPAQLAYDGTLGMPTGGSSYAPGDWDFSANNEPTFDEE